MALNTVMVSVYAKCRIFFCYAEPNCAECRNAECRYAECRHVKGRGAQKEIKQT